MPNSYFQFKQFKVEQDQCAMKVCTDACLFGAWAAFHLQVSKTVPKRILDIGTGTGLLSLMLAQSSDALIDAVEIAPAAAQQASSNAANSPWKERIQIIEGDILDLALANASYDFIISNPPFFENNLKSPDSNRNLAMHSSVLSLQALVQTVAGLLQINGHFAVLIPYERKSRMESLAIKKGLILIKSTDVQQSDQHGFFRTMLVFAKQNKPFLANSISIKINNVYSPAFRELLSTYYLPF